MLFCKSTKNKITPPSENTQFRMFSLSAPNAWILFFSAFFCSNLALAAAALSGGRVVLVLEPSKLESRLEGTYACRRPLVSLCFRSSEVLGRNKVGFGGLDAILNMDGLGLAWQLLSWIERPSFWENEGSGDRSPITGS